MQGMSIARRRAGSSIRSSSFRWLSHSSCSPQASGGFENAPGCRGGVGTIGWPGAYGGWWQADPNDGSVLIFLTHNMLELQQMMRGIGLGVWEAIVEFHGLATARA